MFHQQKSTASASSRRGGAWKTPPTVSNPPPGPAGTGPRGPCDGALVPCARREPRPSTGGDPHTGWDRYWGTDRYGTKNPLPHRCRRRLAGRAASRTGWHRLGQHRRHQRPGTPGAHRAAGGWHPDRGTPVRARPAPAKRFPLPRRPSPRRRYWHLPGPRLRRDSRWERPSCCLRPRPRSSTEPAARLDPRSRAPTPARAPTCISPAARSRPLRKSPSGSGATAAPRFSSPWRAARA